MSIHNLTGDKLYLKHAVDLADRMVPTFDTKSGLPLSSVNLAKSIGIPDQYSPNLISTAEAATLQLEFKYLAELTHNESYWRKVENVMAVINKAKLSNNLVPIYMKYVVPFLDWLRQAPILICGCTAQSRGWDLHSF